jgi:hypothetical protein
VRVSIHNPLTFSVVGEFVLMHVQVAVRAENNEITLFIPATISTSEYMMDLELARLIDKETELAGVLVFNFKELFGRLSCIAHCRLCIGHLYYTIMCLSTGKENHPPEPL